MIKLERDHKLEIFKLHKEGKSAKQISDLLKCRENSICEFLKRHNRVANSNKNNKNYRGKRSEVNKRLIHEYIKNHPCVDCGNADIRVLEFDHVRGKKLGNVTQMARNGCDTSKLLEEIDKCEIRCCNCHRIVTINRRIKPK